MNAQVLPDEDEGVPHPRKNSDLRGHDQAEKVLLDAFNSGRLAHAWLLCGPRGIGKATLAYRFARFLLAKGGEAPADNGLFGEELPKDDLSSLSVSIDDPVFHRIAAGAHADLKVIERQFDEKKGKYKTEIVVDDVRSIGSFMSLSAAEGGWRVVIIDSADEMNRNAANAVLKVLEEPPAKAILLLVSHNSGRLLPTIRSRCRKLTLSTLDEAVVTGLLSAQHPQMSPDDAGELARLAEGSIGRALDLEEEGGLELYRDILELLESLPRLDVAALHTLAGKLGRAGADMAFQTFADLLLGWLGRMILSVSRGDQGVGSPEQLLNNRLGVSSSLASWLEVWDKINHLLARTDAINMDRRQMIITIFLALEKAAQG
ncbi:MAG: DNA polymerase III subunit delta' [Rhodospirillaceae bacterium]|nr:DNA polymerase III subunit delta' [Rhodospirillaceae bacterium]MBL6930346.1 DNA polymerase III subunit delta' [Rhodospirillales bacterium]MBL6941475.1 DNA polymerase III subunit delta' [Rhodospirillales bacterium]